MKGRADLRELTAKQLPLWADFTVVDEEETEVSPHEGFIFKVADELRIGDWRLRPSGASLYVEYWNGASWSIKHTFS